MSRSRQQKSANAHICVPLTQLSFTKAKVIGLERSVARTGCRPSPTASYVFQMTSACISVHGLDHWPVRGSDVLAVVQSGRRLTRRPARLL